MANKLIMLVWILVSATIFMVGAPRAEAQIVVRTSIIQGTVFCTANGSIGVNGTDTPVFPNAQVQLRCGPNDQAVASATTNAQGAFTIIATSYPLSLENLLLTNCRVVVATPLSACNSTLPSTGRLVSNSITFVSSTFGGNIFNIIRNFVVSGFQFQAVLNA